MSAFMQFGSIKKGEALAKDHEGANGWIEILAVSFGSSRTIAAALAGKREASAPVLSDVTVTRHVDSTSPLLFRESLLGKPEKVLIHLTTTGLQRLETYLALTLKGALISSYLVTNVGQHAGRPVETIAINYKEMEFTYCGFDDDGRQDPDRKQTAVYDAGTVTAKK